MRMVIDSINRFHFFSSRIRQFPPKPRLLTSEEFHAQSVLETTKALEELRAFCNSPDSKPWRMMTRLKSPQRLENVRTDIHIVKLQLTSNIRFPFKICIIHRRWFTFGGRWNYGIWNHTNWTRRGHQYRWWRRSHDWLRFRQIGTFKNKFIGFHNPFLRFHKFTIKSLLLNTIRKTSTINILFHWRKQNENKKIWSNKIDSLRIASQL